jgi:molybdopterin converting factor small subunit
MRVKLLYFASLADHAGCGEETRETAATNPRDLYAEVARAHGFAFAPERLRIAVNGELTGWERALADGDEVVFLPPVSGG